MTNTVAYNGRVIRADSQTTCDVCEFKAPSGSKVACIALDDTWTTICKTCLQNLYMVVYGGH